METEERRASFSGSPNLLPKPVSECDFIMLKPLQNSIPRVLRDILPGKMKVEPCHVTKPGGAGSLMA